MLGLTKINRAGIKWADIERYVGVKINELKDKLSCPEPMTVAELSALSASGGLRVGCHYVVTDYYSDGTTLPVDSIVFLATAPDKVAMEVQVNTPLDNDTALTGVMDSILGRLISVRDSKRSNKIEKTKNIESFPWADNNVTDVTCDSTSTLAIANGVYVYGLTLDSGATVSLNSGTHTNLTVSMGAFLDQVGSGNITSVSVSEKSSLRIGDVNISSTSISNESVVDTSNSSGFIKWSEFSGTTASAMQGEGVTILKISLSEFNSATLNLAGASEYNATNVSAHGGAVIKVSSGSTLSQSGGEVSGKARLNVINNSNVAMSGTYIRNGSIGTYDNASDSNVALCSFNNECYFGDSGTPNKVLHRGVASNAGYWQTHGGTSDVTFRWSDASQGYKFNVDLSTATQATYSQLRMTGAGSTLSLALVPSVGNASVNW